ncbi:hypothetical protein [Paracoccus xiamenensis]|uniref:hypothetical protein n=1 Tax=Paracoccus xiamenensis TaxID=2714901 RepID=UPI00140A6CD3|nr:hypothetical protein [Paracoccus xiamenensis]NHF72096.1 hypothetical protein [Paracoccus xiamenensis]
MKKVSIKIATLGDKKHFDGLDEVIKIKSSIIDFWPTIETHQFSCLPDEEWGYSARAISHFAPGRDDEDILILVAGFPIEENYILKRVGDSRIILTSFEVNSILKRDRIRFSNLVARYCYSVSLMYLCKGESLLSPDGDWTRYAHADTRGCLFDMTPHKDDIAVSCDRPIICDECQARLRSRGVQQRTLEIASSEIYYNIRKSLYWSAVDFAERHPVAAFVVATLWGLTVGVSASILAALLT